VTGVMSNRTFATIALCALLATTAGACSNSKHAGGSGSGATTNAAGTTVGGSAGGTSGAGASGSSGAAGSGSGTGSGAGSGTTRTTLPSPTTTAPSTPDWLKAHRNDLKALKTATNAVNTAFQANDDKAKTTALIQCANAALPLAQSAKGSLPTAQADAIVTISDGCASMAHDLKSGDPAAVATTKSAFDKALVVVTPLFP
jgi:hypothetical protein